MSLGTTGSVRATVTEPAPECPAWEKRIAGLSQAVRYVLGFLIIISERGSELTLSRAPAKYQPPIQRSAHVRAQPAVRVNPHRALPTAKKDRPGPRHEKDRMVVFFRLSRRMMARKVPDDSQVQ